MNEITLREIMTNKVKELQNLRTQLQQIDGQREQLLQQGLELQGAIKQLNELVTGLKEPVSSPPSNGKKETTVK